MLARSKGYMDKDIFANYKLQSEFVTRNYLTMDEINRMMQYENEDVTLQLVRDTFLFSCFTGLSYVDIRGLVPQNIQKINKQLWVNTTRRKTGSEVNVRLFTVPYNILLKYMPARLSPKRGFRKRSRSMRPGTRLPRQLPFRRVSPSKQSVNYWDIKTYAQRRSMRISPIRISAERWNACQNVSTRCAPTGRRRACRTSRKGSTKSLFSPLASPSGWGKSRNQQKTLRNGDCKL